MNTTSDHQENADYILAPEEVVWIPTTAEMVMPDPRPEGALDLIFLDDLTAKYEGLIKGYDEKGHYIFSVEIESKKYFGEIGRFFSEDKSEFSVMLSSFGYTDENAVPGPNNLKTIFSESDVYKIKKILIKMIKEFLTFKEIPSIVNGFNKSKFSGEIFLANGWILHGQRSNE